MKIKQRPEDFSVRESYRFDPVEGGRFRVYLMDKQKLSTYDAVDRIRERFGLKPASISFCGLKDKQGRTEQLIAVDGADVDMQDPDLRLKFLGRTDRALSAANTTSNRFSVTVRALTTDDLTRLNVSAAEVARLGVVNYFDSQRFGSLKHGQGFIAKDLIRGDFEAALKNHLAKPSPLDRSEDAKVKQFWKENWRHFDRRAPFAANKKYFRILNVLRDEPENFEKAFLQIDASYRALLLFTYQSYLWNEGARRLLQLVLPREHMFPLPYQAGTVLFHKDADPETLRYLRGLTFPLLAPDSKIDDPKVREAVDWVLGKEKLKLEDLRIPGAKRMLFFKHEERPLLVYPQKLVLGRPGRDELNPGMQKLNVAFTLPPGSYATLVIKRLFHFSYRDDRADEHYATPTGPGTGQALPAASESALTAAPRRREGRPARAAPVMAPAAAGPGAGRGRAAPERERTAPRPATSARDEAKAQGFRAQQKARKAAKAAARTAQADKRSKSRTKHK